MTVDLRTEREKKTQERQKAVCSDFVIIKGENPQCKTNRIIKALAEKHGLSMQGVMGILKRGGVYTL